MMINDVNDRQIPECPQGKYMSFKAPISLIVIPAVVCCGFGCIKPEPARDIMSDDIIVGDSLIDSSDPDSVDWDTLLDGVVDVKPDDICGLVDADPVHVEGQPCGTCQQV